MSTSNPGRLHVEPINAELTANAVGELLMSLRMARRRLDTHIPSKAVAAGIVDLDLRIATLEAVHKSLLGDSTMLRHWQATFTEVIQCR